MLEDEDNDDDENTHNDEEDYNVDDSFFNYRVIQSRFA